MFASGKAIWKAGTLWTSYTMAASILALIGANFHALTCNSVGHSRQNKKEAYPASHLSNRCMKLIPF